MIIKLDKIDSTNIYAIKNFETLIDSSLITAKSQTSGRGRRQNFWYSPDCENLYCSYVLKTNDYNYASSSSIIGALSVLHLIKDLKVINEEVKKKIWIKWPNDIYFDDKKISGILAETVTNSSNQLQGVIIGIGININMNEELCRQISKPCTSLRIETGIKFELDFISNQLLKGIIHIRELAKNKEALYSIWKNENKIIGKKVSVELSKENIVTGEAIDISQNGELIIKDVNNKFHNFLSGDVTIKKIT